MTANHPVSAPPPALVFPGWIERLIIAVALCSILAVRLIGQTANPPYPFDRPDIRNLLTLIFGFIVVLTAWIWYCFRSGYSLAWRRAAFIGSFAALVLFFACFRLREFSGSMAPTFVPRWSAGLGRQLSDFQPASAAQIDLTTTSPDDFPQFLGPARSAWIAGPPIDRDWSAHPPRLLWKQPIGAGWSGFASANGYAVTLEQRGDEEWVVCYELATGRPVWGHSLAARHENPLGGVGPRGTPTIHEGRVYALGATGVLRCIDGATGKLLWSDDLRARYGLSAAADEALVMWGRSASPLIVDRQVVVPGGGPAAKAKNLIAFDAASGTVAWESENKQPDGTPDQISYASPSLVTLAGRRQILIVNETTVSGHDPATGERLWSHSWLGHSNGDANCSQAVAVDENHVLLSKGYSGGAELLVLSSSGATSPITADTVWKSSRVLQTKFTNVVVREGHAYGLSEGILECVDLATGKRKWKSGRYEHGQILGVDDLLLVLAESGDLHLVELNPAKFVHLGSKPALSGKTWNTLCLAGRRLLVRNAQEAACYELP